MPVVPPELVAEDPVELREDEALVLVLVVDPRPLVDTLELVEGSPLEVPLELDADVTAELDGPEPRLAVDAVEALEMEAEAETAAERRK